MIEYMLKIINVTIWRVYLPQIKSGSPIITEKLLNIWKLPEMLYLFKSIMCNTDKIKIIIELEKILKKINNNNGYPSSCVSIKNELYNGIYKRRYPIIFCNENI